MFKAPRALSLLVLVVLIGCGSSRACLGPMIQLGNTDGRSEMMVVWRTSGLADSRIEYGSYLDSEKIVFDPMEVYYHSLRLTGLKPDTEYFYRVFSNDILIGQFHFRTGKSDYQPFRFVVFGDSGTGKSMQYKVAAEIEKNRPDFILHTGDLVYGKGEDENYLNQFYDPYRKLISKILFFPSLGNHDYGTEIGQPFLNNFVLPGNERYYSFDYGNAHFVALDSNRVDEESARWLENDLANNGKLWKVIFFHHPPPFATGHVGDKAILDLWVPLFEKYDVDLVFVGHQHIYARYQPLNGVRYIVEGVCGKNLHDVTLGSHLTSWDNKHWGFGSVDIIGKKLIFRHITHQGFILDQFSLEK